MIEIAQIFGTRAGVPNTPTDLDGVWWHDPARKKPLMIGFAHRTPGAELFLHYGLSVPESVVAEARRKLAQRDAEAAPESMRAIVESDAGGRTVSTASGVEAGDDDEEDE